MNPKAILYTLFSLLLISACATQSVSLFEPGQYKPKMEFIDISKFDRDLSTSLSDKHDSVEVAFYDKVSPNNVPDRLQK